MARKNRIPFPLILFFIVVFVLVYFQEQLEQRSADKISVFRFEAKQPSASTGLKIIHPSQFSNETGFKCLKTNLEHLSFPICVYEPNEDHFVSRPFHYGGYYEKDLVTKFIRLLKTHEDVTLVDLGANIGVYSLPVSHLERHVVAVEANPDTYRRLAKSIHLGGVSKHIEALNYAITDVDQSTAVLQINLSNRGASFLTNNVSCNTNCSVVVPTTTLDRLLPLLRNRKVVIKADVESSEIKIFTETGAGELFKIVEVTIIMMEWDLYTRYHSQTESDRNMVGHFLEFFYKRGYDVYDPRSEKKLSADWLYWPGLVLFKKQSLPTDKLLAL